MPIILHSSLCLYIIFIFLSMPPSSCLLFLFPLDLQTSFLIIFSYNFFLFQPDISVLSPPYNSPSFFFRSSFSYSCYKLLFSLQFLNSSASFFTVFFAFLLISLSSFSSALYNFQFLYSSASIISLSLSLLFCTANLITSIQFS